MSQEWYLMNSPIQYSGYENDYMSDYGANSFSELLDTFAGEDVTIYNSTLTNYAIYKAIISDKTSNTSLKKYELSLLLPLNSCTTGMYVKYKDKYWLVTSYVNDNIFYKKTIVELCTYTIKFQHPVTGTILSYPCITTNRIQGTGDKNTSIMTLPDGRKLVTLPQDENTILLQNSETKTWRFFIDNHPTTPRVYKLSFADTTSSVGLIELYCDEDKYNQLTDNVILGVCDYEPTTDTPEPPNPDIPTEIVTIYSDDITNNKIKLGIPYSFYATFKNEKGEDIPDIIAEYSVDNTYNGKVNLIDNGDGTCTVTVGRYSDTGLVNKQFILTCTDIINNVSSSILLTIVGLY